MSSIQSIRFLHCNTPDFAWSVVTRGVALKKEVWERRFHKRGFSTPFQKVVWERHAKKEVWECRSHTKQKKLNQIVRIKWAFAYKNFHTGSFVSLCKLFTSSANLRVASPVVRLRFNVIFWIPHLQVTLLVQRGVGTPFPPHYTPAHDGFGLLLSVYDIPSS